MIKKELLDIITSIATLLTFFSGAYIAYQAKRHFMLSRATDFIHRFNSLEMTQARSTADKLIRAKIDLDELVHNYYARELSEQDETTYMQLKMFANFFQELAPAYLHGTIDKKYTWDFFGYLVTHYWHELKPFVLAHRSALGRKTIYNDFELMQNAMRKFEIESA